MALTPQPQPQRGDTVVVPVDKAAARLAEMGLKPDHLRRAVETGDLGRRRCGPHHPRQSAAQTMWSDTVAGLRAILAALQQDWKDGRTDNLDTAYHTERKIAVAVASGDEFTGRMGSRHPRLRRKRGPATQRRVAQNLGQLALFSGPTAVEPGPNDDVHLTTWYLVLFADTNEIRMELSLPVGRDGAGYVGLWDTRILIESLPVSGGVSPVGPDDDGPDEPDVSVGRR